MTILDYFTYLGQPHKLFIFMTIYNDVFVVIILMLLVRLTIIPSAHAGRAA